MARALYTLLWYVALPLLPLRLWWRGRKEPGYRERIGERFGRYANVDAPATDDVIWIHAVSLGETRAAAPLVARLRRARPAATIVMTHMTATGRAAGAALYGGDVVQAWLPYDVPFAVDAFLARFRPRAGLLMETELWPNLVAACRAARIPLFLVNARLSQRSADGYARVARLARPMIASLAGIAAQTADDAARLAALGARDVAVLGNVKFDAEVPDAARAAGHALRARIGSTRPVWIAGSTRDGEEALIVDAIAAAPLALPRDTLTIVVPRHPQRFDEVAALLEARRIPYVRRSSNTAIAPATRVMLGDTMGEMLAYYASSDVAFVGGSLLPFGGQNLIEPLALGLPTLIGPHTFNFAEAASQATAAGAARRVEDADRLVAQAGGLLADAALRAKAAASATAFIAEHRGAADRLWAWLDARLPPAVSPATAG